MRRLMGFRTVATRLQRAAETHSEWESFSGASSAPSGASFWAVGCQAKINLNGMFSTGIGKGMSSLRMTIVKCVLTYHRF